MSGTVAYLIKGQTKYPPRLYVLWHWEKWNRRNLKPMGLMSKVPIATRPMTNWELEASSTSWRGQYWQYESKDLLPDLLDEKGLSRFEREEFTAYACPAFTAVVLELAKWELK